MLSDVDEAVRAARALRDSEPVWLEEPTIPDDVPGHVRIVREGHIREEQTGRNIGYSLLDQTRRE